MAQVDETGGPMSNADGNNPDGIDRQELQSLTAPIRQALETRLKELSNLGFRKGGEDSLGHQGAHLPPNSQNGADVVDLSGATRGGANEQRRKQALRPAVIHRKRS
ncbi:hypothetical protein KBY66_14025 [Synechococcus sp. Tobar12-5m-g]|uniref:hypothetical protein n=1 Tax=unclassified Synechococcus TaxID=2626047 RepID=UPI0020CE7187|nr:MULTISPECIES: hypothetical protein [unclassified Synechococcus]MCP9773715.1 hypothetical protein [Synechococcus sp. Tobar12-5m-g]MCP9874672.1 hypothetical protein [Synechococcus sp. Cruz CV-v-12]